ncbi:hypothetical protein HanRHA438_Chr03g0106841 [Helianthus annuus]|nr:hypothetical protein HanIR_Chr03g0104551 [Helianthus annuus]KAJ0767052.1 hypothetical protein HanLR1_Chr03g0084631 [Helianthus annuus]KAJ0934388.1 hypothetical protein HanRHA438_Chr03g0106841 [Helianthus annuus]
MEPSSRVMRTSCSFASCLINLPSNGLQNRASATVTEIPSSLRSSLAAKQLCTMVPYPNKATLLPCLSILPLPTF